MEEYTNPITHIFEGEFSLLETLLKMNFVAFNGAWRMSPTFSKLSIMFSIIDRNRIWNSSIYFNQFGSENWNIINSPVYEFHVQFNHNEAWWAKFWQNLCLRNNECDFSRRGNNFELSRASTVIAQLKWNIHRKWNKNWNNCRIWHPFCSISKK